MAFKELHKITRADADSLTAFIKESVEKAHAKGAVVGISGGVDSAVVAKLCADALGGENVLCVFMPTAVTPGEDYVQTKAMCKSWNIRYKAISIQSAVDAFSGMLLTGKEAPLEKGNIMARCRMIVLYDKAKKEDYLVIGTTNRSELLMGYMTKFGDGAEDVMPMYNPYKTQDGEGRRGPGRDHREGPHRRSLGRSDRRVGDGHNLSGSGQGLERHGAGR